MLSARSGHSPRGIQLRRPLLPTAVLTVALGTALASFGAPAQQEKLPDIGSSAGQLLSPSQQAQYGGMLLAQLRNYDYLLEDPLIDGWLDTLGSRLAANSHQPRQPFTFFVMDDRQINAFATLGGYIGVNAGLVLTAESEDEVAAVLSHEIAHVTQEHVLRAVERAQRDQLPVLLAMLGAIAIAQSGGGNSSDDATQAVMAGAMGLMQQRQINYTRSNEHEADRLGIQTLARSHYDVDAMAGFFEKMQVASRANSGTGGYYGVPEYLRTHPVSTTRISEAKARALQIEREPGGFQVSGGASDNPLLPHGFTITGEALESGGTGQFELARERLRVLSASSPREAIREYERIERSGKLDPAQRYGLAIAHLRAGEAATAAETFEQLLRERPGDVWVSLALAEAEVDSGNREDGDARFEALVDRLPGNRAVALTYARVLSERNTVEAGQRAQEILRPLLARAGDDAMFQRTYARASEIAGEPIRAGEAYAEAALLSGRPERALVQLNTLKKHPDVDYYARARIEARIAQITPLVLELKRQGIRDEDLERD